MASGILCKIMAALAIGVSVAGNAQAASSLLNLSFSVTPELYQEYDAVFARYWKAEMDEDIIIRHTHAASGKQAQAVLEGEQADMVTLALPYDIDLLARQGEKMPVTWQVQLQNWSTPFVSPIVFLVRADNPKGIKDWDDLIKANVQLIASDPSVSGGGRWTYLAAWGNRLSQTGGDETLARAYVTEFYKHVTKLEGNSREATRAFVQDGIGDVLVGWESEALRIIAKRKNEYQLVIPSNTILAQPPVAIVSEVSEARETTFSAKAYLDYLYMPEGQKIVVKHYFRPGMTGLLEEKDLAHFPRVNTFRFDEYFEDWQTVHARHFAKGGVFEQIYQK